MAQPVAWLSDERPGNHGIARLVLVFIGLLLFRLNHGEDQTRKNNNLKRLLNATLFKQIINICFILYFNCSDAGCDQFNTAIDEQGACKADGSTGQHWRSRSGYGGLLQAMSRSRRRRTNRHPACSKCAAICRWIAAAAAAGSSASRIGRPTTI